MVSTDQYIIRELEEGIIENSILDKTIVDTDLAHELKRINMSIAQGKKYGIVVTADPYTSITSEARQLISSPEYKKDTLAKAIIVQSLPQRIVSNFYLRFNKPAIPTRLFNDKESAMQWLRKHSQTRKLAS